MPSKTSAAAEYRFANLMDQAAMPDELGVLCFISVVLAAVVLIGHGLWLLAAAFFRAIFSGVAGHSAAVGDLRATLRQLDRLLASGLIDPQEHRRMVLVIRNELARRGEPLPPLSVAAQRTQRPAVEELRHPAPQTMRDTRPATEAAETTAELDEIEIIEDVEIVDDEPIAPAAIGAAPPGGARPEERPAVAQLQAATSGVHPLDQPDPVHSEPPRSRQALADLLQSFMDEKNIRWGELVSGMLIVGGAVGLVISLRATLNEWIPYFPALLFMLVTAAVHYAGIYTLRHWKLANTSRGVLIIGLLLVPLNFVAAIVLSGSDQQIRSVADPAYLGAVTVGLAAFGLMTFVAARALAPSAWMLIWTGVMGASAGQLLINRPELAWAPPMALLAIPGGAFVVAVLSAAWRVSQRRQLSLSRAQESFLVLGTSSFALLTALALLLGKSTDASDTLARLSPLLSICAATVLVAGLAVHVRASSRRVAAVRTAGTTIALLGGVLMAAALWCAWPQPQLLVAVGLVNLALLIAAAIAARLPVLLGVAVANGAIAWLVGFHLARGMFDQFENQLSQRHLDLALSGESSLALAALAIIVAAVAPALRHMRRQQEAFSIGVSAAALGGLSTLIALVVGFFRYGNPESAPDLATIVMATAAVGLLSGGGQLRNRWVIAAGCALLWTTLIHSLAVNSHARQWLENLSLLPDRPILTATITNALLCGMLAALAQIRTFRLAAAVRESFSAEVTMPLLLSSLTAAVAATPFVIFVRQSEFGWHAAYAVAIAAVWLIAAIVSRRSDFFAAFEALATVALAFSVAEVCRHREWGDRWFVDARHIYAQISVLAGWTALWSEARFATTKYVIAQRLIAGVRPTVDQVVLGAIVAALVSLPLFGCLPLIFTELRLGALPSELTAIAIPLVSHSTAHLAFVVTMAALAAALWERPSSLGVAGAILAGAAAPLFVAARFANDLATVSALRWTLALYFVVLALLLCARKPLRTWLLLVRRHPFDRFPPGSYQALRTLAIVVAAAPVVVLTTVIVLRVAAGEPPLGPAANSIFATIGNAVSYAAPLAFVVAALAAFAVVDRAPTLALAGSLVLQYVLVLACLLPVLTAGEQLTTGVMAQLGQFSAVGFAVYGAAWLGLRSRIDARGRDSAADEWPLGLHTLATGLTPLLLSGWAAVAIFAKPDSPGMAVAQLGTVSSYVAWTVALVGIWMFVSNRNLQERWLILGVYLLAICPFIAASVSEFGTAQNWVGCHVLLVAWLVLAACSTAGVIVSRPKLPPSASDRRAAWPATNLVRLAIVAGGLALLLGMRICIDDPQAPWWSAAAGAATSLLAGFLAIARRRQPLAYLATILGAVAATTLWLGAWLPFDLPGLIELVHLNLLAVIVWAGVWLALEINAQRRRETGLDLNFRGPPVHRVAAPAAFWTMLPLTWLGLVAAVTLGDDLLAWTSLFVLVLLAVLLIVSLWEQRAAYAIAGFYVTGLTAWAMGIEFLVAGPAPLFEALSVLADRPQEWSYLLATLGLAAHVALAGYVWRRGRELALLGARCGILDPAAALRRTANWLPAANLVLSAAAAFLALVGVLVLESRGMRVAAAFAPALVALGIAATAWEQRNRPPLQVLALLAAAGSAVLLSWADLHGDLMDWSADVWLLRVVRMLIVLSAATLLYSGIASRLSHGASDWFGPTRRAATVIGIAALAALGQTLLVEAAHFEPGVGMPLDGLHIIAVAVVLVGLAAGLILLALMPSRDPLSLNEKRRMVYVYAAQAVAGLLFAHIYFARPQWFEGVLREYWPFIVVAIAFAGVGLSELFHRSRIRVLAEPLERTAALLPILPALGMWVFASRSEYSAVLFVAGLVYMLLSLLRRSFLHALAAALAGNAALWAFLAESEGLDFAEHPQFWLVPPAISVLVATHLNRRRLTENQLTFVRYACLTAIYLSSTSEMFIQGLGEHLWPPMILAALAVAGVFAGIALRIRAFLFLGVSFVFLSVVSMVWHAGQAVGHVWPWWVFVIGMGVLILTVFGLFEKKRTEVMLLINQLRQWEK